jgi:AraC family transcriptional regulator
MLMNSSCVNVAPYGTLDRKTPQPRQAALLPSPNGRACSHEKQYEHFDTHYRLLDPPMVDETNQGVQVCPTDVVKRRTVTWDGVAAEIVQATRREKLEFRFRAPLHLLAVCDQGIRSDGDTFVEGLPRSRLRDMTRKLTFVPAGHAYHEWHEPRVLTRVVYFYFDPARMPSHPEEGVASAPLAPRLLFEDATLSDTALKLKRLIETTGADNSPYFEALGTVLAHELVRLNSGTQRSEAPAKGGLAAWQQRIATAYIEEHLAEQISLATLAGLVGLSPYYFCRAFKQSLGMPPNRYHSSRRIEHAKILLAKPAPSVTDIGLTVGYSETSSFTSAFHKTTGVTPTAYRRTLT